jgi:putative SOS response-associated peptidase YedK
MCNRYGYNNPYAALLRAFERLGMIRWNGAEPNTRVDIRPTDKGPVIRDDGGLELADLRWGFVPDYWSYSLAAWKESLKPKPGSPAARRGPNPMTNARADSIKKTAGYKDAYAHKRCLVVASEYYEWKKLDPSPKAKSTMFRHTVIGEPTFAIAGIWARALAAEDGLIESYSMLTTDAGPDAAVVHHRQPVILRPDQWADWLAGADMADSFKGGSPAGTLHVERFDPAAVGALL